MALGREPAPSRPSRAERGRGTRPLGPLRARRPRGGGVRLERGRGPLLPGEDPSVQRQDPGPRLLGSPSRGRLGREAERPGRRLHREGRLRDEAPRGRGRGEGPVEGSPERAARTQDRGPEEGGLLKGRAPAIHRLDLAGALAVTRAVAFALAFLAIGPGAVEASSAGLVTWALSTSGSVSGPSPFAAQKVGSLQKAWVLEAWGRAHPEGEAAPHVFCAAGSRCWARAGHGRIGLARAVSVSCNEYFLALARSLPGTALVETLEAAGFEIAGHPGAEGAVGLADADGAVTVSPAALLAAYRALVSTGWSVRDDLRLEFLEGMREAGRSGTGAQLGRAGLLVKTGTVAGRAGRVEGTTGWALAADPSGERLWLARLDPGTGAAAAARLGTIVGAEGAGTARPSAVGRVPRAGGDAVAGADGPLPRGCVRILLFPALRPGRVTAKNVGAAPAGAGPKRASRAVGPGATVGIEPGDRLAESTWELSISPYGLVRRLRGSIEAAPTGPLSLVLESSARDWVDGVLLGELGTGLAERSAELAAAALRFLSRAPRHVAADVCDQTHCARFLGLGPLVDWATPVRASPLAGPTPPRPALSDGQWLAAVEAARLPGPSFWSAHCGGAPLSERAVWGSGTEEAEPCPRHAAPSSPWQRTLRGPVLSRAFGEEVLSMEAVDSGGVLRTRVTLGSGPVELLYDELHARLARQGSWDLLPSPPDRFARVRGGFVASGRGRGHRVGLCLAE